MNSLYQSYNPNPHKSRVGDCTIRAICKATGKPWDEVYVSLCAFGFNSKDMPSANVVWGDYLYSLGFRRYLVEEMHYTVADFAHDHPEGVYILALDSGTLGHFSTGFTSDTYAHATNTAPKSCAGYWKCAEYLKPP